MDIRNPDGECLASTLQSAIRASYEKLGATEHSPLPLHANDGTVAFTPCTISNYRTMFTANVAVYSEFCFQPCLRFQALQEMKPNVFPSGSLLFTMYGGFERCTKDDIATKFVQHVSLYSDALARIGCNNRKIVIVGLESVVQFFGEEPDCSITSAPNDKIVDQELEVVLGDKVGCDTPSIITVPDSYSHLQWSYGNRYSGQGVRILIENDNQSFTNVGNVIVVMHPEGNIIGIDSGGGFEKTMEALYGGRASFDWSGVFGRFDASAEHMLDPNWVNLFVSLEGLIHLADNPRSYRHPLSVVRNDLELCEKQVRLFSDLLDLDHADLISMINRYIERTDSFDLTQAHKTFSAIPLETRSLTVLSH